MNIIGLVVDKCVRAHFTNARKRAWTHTPETRTYTDTPHAQNGPRSLLAQVGRQTTHHTRRTLAHEQAASRSGCMWVEERRLSRLTRRLKARKGGLLIVAGVC